MKVVRTEDAVGHILPHDMTRIVKDVVKERAFKKGHVITEEDIPVLLSMGKEHIYVMELEDDDLHENDCAIILKDICINEHMHSSDIKEGKIEIISDVDGFLKVDRDRLFKLNSIDDISIATVLGNQPVKKGQKIAGMRIIPLFTKEKVMDEAKKIMNGVPILEIIPFDTTKKCSIITTGSEVYKGLIKDQFGPVLKEKMRNYNCEVINHVIVDDNSENITREINKALENKSDIILVSGGMSVDPDDMTPKAIKDSKAEVITYGSPVLPGAMFMLAYKNDTAIMGLPGCVMFNKSTVFDIILPYIFANIKVTKDMINSLGYGGFCMQCSDCHFPNCEYGKGLW